MAVAAILVAAGSGSRLMMPVPKAFVPIAGRTLLEHAVSRFAAHAGISVLVVVAPESHLDEARTLSKAQVVAGGATRQASVAAGLAAVPAEVEFVLVHDVARPLVPGHVIDAVLTALQTGADAVVPVVPVADTVRRIGPDGSLAGTVDRSELVRVQTPQGFRRSVLVEAHAQAQGSSATDDAALVEALGGVVVAVPGDEEALKITTPAEYVWADALARLHLSSPHLIHEQPGGTP